MKKRLIKFLVLLAACVGTIILFFIWTYGHPIRIPQQQSVSSPPASIKTKMADNDTAQQINKALVNQHFNGSALVIQNGKTLIDTGYGYADFNKKTKNTPNTKHWIGSISKTVIGVSILQLQEEGKLNIQDNVHKYISVFPANKNITLYELLTHTSGIAATGGGNIIAFSPKDLVNWIGQQKLAYPPGKGYAYSDRNYIVLAYIVEKVSGERLDLYVKKHIFIPAGMKDSGIALDHSMLTNLSRKDTGIPNIATGYVKEKNGITKAWGLNLLWLYGCGDMYTTTHDMYKLDVAIVTNKILSPASVALMFAPREHHYGFGFRTRPSYVYNHGVVSGWNAYNDFNWDKRTFVILFSNVQNSLDDTFNEKILSMVIHQSI
ncbi:serine hydrolase domain-containing protein [Ectobacillus panaciterrae]|uniref:serine hydrolase domain-containing protein n=1 Tax=Ectobacillus panaciterrae TaxID=363872 RepID=UPI00048D4631|nr:serine hydrolase domain-containing protein [Ectobacillus panaciterrae]